MGCIGAWTMYHLLQQGKKAVNFDLSEERHRLDLLMSREEQEAGITFVKGDLTDAKAVRSVMEDFGITHIIHLAALQVPSVRANPVLGANVNVTGTVNVFEAAKQVGLKHVVYASSIAVYGAAKDYPPGLLAHDAPMNPATLYGVFKIANEGTAKIYYSESGITSTVLRAYTVYGLGRDFGLTSEPTKAMLAAAKGEDFHISFGGRMQFHYASDVARQFIEAAEKPLDGAYGFNLGTMPVAVSEVAELIMQVKPGVKITVGDTILPFPEGCDPTELYNHFGNVYETPLDEGVRQTIAGFERSLS
jgi:nucleoside-diphosphate-sugar epimerase